MNNQIQKPNHHKGAVQTAPVVTPSKAEPTDEEIMAQLDAEEKSATVEIQKSKDVQVDAQPAKPLNKVQKRAAKIPLTPIDVIATEIGFYGNRRIKVGDKFKLEDEMDFSHNWMEKI